jgi:hypothetical protein
MGALDGHSDTPASLRNLVAASDPINVLLNTSS